MANAAIFMGFGPLARGREREALELFSDAVQIYSDLQQRGEIESFEPVLLQPHGGDLRGFVLIRGETEQLDRIRNEEQFQRISARAAAVVDSFRLLPAHIGEGFSQQMELFGEELERRFPS